MATLSPHSHSDSGVLQRLLFRVAKKWVAGNDQSDALSAARASNAKGISAIMNFLGEDTLDPSFVDRTLEEYMLLVDTIGSSGIKGCVSVKPTQLGLALGYDLCLENYEKLAARAKNHGQFLWLDMESAKFAEDILSLYLDLLSNFQGMVGVALQAYLRRSPSDLLHLMEQGGIVRLVKGAYHEPDDVAFSSREEVDESYSKLMKVLFESKNRFAIATHDSALIDEAIRLSGERQGSESRFEFQMLMGIRDDLKPGLVERGFRVSEYIPYGSHWLPYSVRRLRERKRNMLLLARSLV